MAVKLNLYLTSFPIAVLGTIIWNCLYGLPSSKGYALVNCDGEREQTLICFIGQEVLRAIVASYAKGIPYVEHSVTKIESVYDDDLSSDYFFPL